MLTRILILTRSVGPLLKKQIPVEARASRAPRIDRLAPGKLPPRSPRPGVSGFRHELYPYNFESFESFEEEEPRAMLAPVRAILGLY